ncbi:hypothetical protein GUJ93_ZPchr0013g37801 [Zizania palustris]|uniref:BRCA1-associated 2/ETP1 RRM domain-containing protein n=1 Tax=Zizania palustris TaxID=103762 RepID=A0A8J5X1K1_ZIZPA|nr:hypothetical protein GUJ93_ZPchr0013g37801 [Zizania palustris]
MPWTIGLEAGPTDPPTVSIPNPRPLLSPVQIQSSLMSLVGSSVVRWMGSRHTFVLGASGYLLFNAVNFVPSWGLLANRLPPAPATAVNSAPALTQPIAPATSVLSLIGIKGLSEANVDKICEAAENLVFFSWGFLMLQEMCAPSYSFHFRRCQCTSTSATTSLGFLASLDLCYLACLIGFIRIDGVKDQYNILIKFDIQSSTNSFYNHFNGRVMFVVFVLWKTINSLSWLSTRIVQLQVELNNLHAQYVLNDLTKTLEAFLLQYATILFTVLSDRN